MTDKRVWCLVFKVHQNARVMCRHCGTRHTDNSANSDTVMENPILLQENFRVCS
jgi:hypothetical protein